MALYKNSVSAFVLWQHFNAFLFDQYAFVFLKLNLLASNGLIC